MNYFISFKLLLMLPPVFFSFLGFAGNLEVELVHSMNMECKSNSVTENPDIRIKSVNIRDAKMHIVNKSAKNLQFELKKNLKELPKNLNISLFTSSHKAHGYFCGYLLDSSAVEWKFKGDPAEILYSDEVQNVMNNVTNSLEENQVAAFIMVPFTAGVGVKVPAALIFTLNAKKPSATSAL